MKSNVTRYCGKSLPMHDNTSSMRVSRNTAVSETPRYETLNASWPGVYVRRTLRVILHLAYCIETVHFLQYLGQIRASYGRYDRTISQD